ncbi:MAG TPA: SpoIIE family protein phosphatase [Candidatus Acidoferrales bacterium]|nr:SpoIIE family protein phosphatase [Candidatus Acidoferrales bacterium]
MAMIRSDPGFRNRGTAVVAWAIGLSVIVAAFVTAGWHVRETVSTSFDQARQMQSARTLVFDATKGQLDEETGVRGYVATRDPAFLQPYRAARQTLPQTLTRLRQAVDSLQLTAASSAAADASEANAAWLREVARPLIRRPQVNTIQLENRGKSLVDRFRADVDAVESAVEVRAAEIQRDFERSLLELGVLVTTAAAVLFVATIVFLALQVRAWEAFDRERRRLDESRLRERGLRAAYDAEKRIADTLQQAFAQRQLPVLPAVAFSGTYVPATEETKVGGDWYDAFEIGDERVLFTIGDIAGHGLDAAVAMSAVRNEVLSAALVDSDGASILARVNRKIVEHGIAPMVTAVIGVADARRFEFSYATAGHPPPLLLEPGRAPRQLQCSGLPLGISRKSGYATSTVQSVPGGMLVLYTDGVIEHSRNVIEGERELIEAVAGVADAENPAASIFRKIFDERSVGDDVAILTIGFPSTRSTGATSSEVRVAAAVSKSATVARTVAPARGLRRAS